MRGLFIAQWGNYVLEIAQGDGADFNGLGWLIAASEVYLVWVDVGEELRVWMSGEYDELPVFAGNE